MGLELRADLAVLGLQLGLGSGLGLGLGLELGSGLGVGLEVCADLTILVGVELVDHRLVRGRGRGRGSGRGRVRVTLNSLRCSEKALDSATLPVSKETRLPPPRAWLMCSLWPGSLGRPG